MLSAATVTKTTWYWTWTERVGPIELRRTSRAAPVRTSKYNSLKSIKFIDLFIYSIHRSNVELRYNIGWPKHTITFDHINPYIVLGNNMHNKLTLMSKKKFIRVEFNNDLFQ